MLALRAAGKPVVVSMGSVAASGGYLIATAADSIVAQPGTITGSIGVVMAKLDASALLKRQRLKVLPVSLDRLGTGAEPLSAARPFSSKQLQQFERLADETYALFRRRVEDGRKLSERAVRDAAKGRVWTGQQAHRRGLVDALGGLDAACVLAP